MISPQKVDSVRPFEKAREMAGIRLAAWLKSRTRFRMVGFRQGLSGIVFLLVAITPNWAPASEPDSLGTIQREDILVTASRSGRTESELPASVQILSSETLRQSPGQTTDDVLRQIPGFSLFRRSAGLVAHPTTQGVSLRGVGASGASRTLVLLDGMPLNDPFGGWVQWGKVPVASIRQVEVLKGGSAHLWGNYALSGVINVVTRPDPDRVPSWSIRAGSHRTVGIDAAYSGGSDTTTWRLSGGYLTTDGFFNIAENRRGSIDRRVSSTTGTSRIFLRHRVNGSTTLTTHVGVFADDRNNGTVLTGNGSKSIFGSTAVSATTGSSGLLTLGLFGQIQRFNSTFSSQAADRSTEQPALDQFHVPSNVSGASATYLSEFSERAAITVGLDARRLIGSTNESFFYRDSTFLRRREAGGRQIIIGGFAQTVFQLKGEVALTIGTRLDRWRNEKGYRREIDTTTGAETRNDVHAAETDVAFSPRAGVRLPLGDATSVRAAGYRTFRSPTLNELYRPFRVGSVITAANARLGGEKLTGAEIGFDHTGEDVTAHATMYWNEIDGSIANLTLAQGPGSIDPCGFVPDGGICRQRLNLTGVRVRGLEAEIGHRGDRFTSTVSYLYAETEIRDAQDLTVRGNRLPQIPVHTGAVRLSVRADPKTQFSLQIRAVGEQFEDVANRLPLDGFAVADLIVSRAVGTKKEVLIQAENLLNTSYDVGISSTGLTTTGTPFRLTVGLRTTR